MDIDYCTGCGICVEACGPKCLEIINNLAVLTQPDKCGSEEHCIEPCPVGCIRVGCIRMEWVERSGDERAGKWQIIPVLPTD